MRFTTILGTAAFLLLAACQKKDNTVANPSLVNMKITSPVAGQGFRNGDTIAIKAAISYPSELHGYEVRLVDTSSGFIVYDNVQHVHTDHFDIDDKWVCNASQAATLKLTIITHIDHDGEDATQDLLLHILP